MAASEDGNDHALKWVINSVDNLCAEYIKAGDKNDGKRQLHLELSTAKILDELQMPTIKHAKHEVLLLYRLQESLSRLIDRCEKSLDASDVVERLKTFRKEMRHLFVQSAKILTSRPKPAIAVERASSPSAIENQTEPTTSVAQRTKTPTVEANRIGYEKDKTEVLTELSAATLAKLISAAKSEPKIEPEPAPAQADVGSGSSTDTKATKTMTPPGSGNEPDERSQRIWTDEDDSERSRAFSPIAQEFRVKPVRSESKPNRRSITKKGDTDAVASPTLTDEELCRLGVTDRCKFDQNHDNILALDPEDVPTIMMRDILTPMQPRTMKVVRFPESEIVQYDYVESEPQPEPQPQPQPMFQLQVEPEPQPIAENAVQENGADRSILNLVLLALSPVIVFLVILWLNEIFRRDGIPRSGLFLVSQAACNVANVFCEHFGVMCTQYCASGLQRDKWRSKD